MNGLLAEQAHAQRAVKDGEETLAEAGGHMDNCRQALHLLQSVAQSVQDQAHRQITSLVSKCLATVFEDAYQLKLTFERKRGKTEACLTFVRDGLEIDPRECGGVLDVAAFALRLASLVLARPAKRKLIVADEPFRFLDKAHLPKVGVLLRRLAHEFGVQFVLTTHSPELMIGKVIEL